MIVSDITPFIEAESDRIVGDDLIAGPQTHTVLAVEGMVDEKKKKRLVVRLDGTDKPFIPCKGMARLMGHLWGPDVPTWVGKSLTLYRDPDVRFGADMTGGVRICAVSDISSSIKVPIRTSQKSVKAYSIEPLAAAKPAPDANARAKAEAWVEGLEAKATASNTSDELVYVIQGAAKGVAKLAREHPDLHAKVQAAYDGRAEALKPADEDEPA